MAQGDHSMSVFPIEELFPSLCTRVYRVEQRWETSFRSATAFLISKRSTRRCVLATAAHVVDDLPRDADIEWKIQQFDDHSRLERQCTFSPNASKTSDVPYRHHKRVDVAFFYPPVASKQPNGNAFFQPDESPLPMIAENHMQGIGTRVCWAGFPALIENYLCEPTLCYAEGVISSMVNTADKHLYIVDGTNSPGFSGGPVWYWSEEHQQFQVMGIVSGYLPSQGFPGFCAFEPINHIKHYLNYWDAEESKITAGTTTLSPTVQDPGRESDAPSLTL